MTTIVTHTAGDESGRERDVVVPLSGKQRRQRREERCSRKDGRSERRKMEGKEEKKERESKGEEIIRDAVRN